MGELKVKNDKTFVEQEYERERNAIKVEKEIDTVYSNNTLKKASLIALALLISGGLFVDGAQALENLNNKMENQEIHQTYEPQKPFICNIEEEYAKNPNIATINIGCYKIYICEPEEKELDGQKVYVAPEGFTLEDGICYRIHCHYSAPIGYITGTDGKAYRLNQDEVLSIPADYIPVGECGLSIVKPETYEIDGKTIHELPEGYLKVGNYGYKVIKATIAKTLGKK